MCAAASISRLALALVFVSQISLAGPPHYRVIDFGTLGGNISYFYTGTRELNEAGELIYQAETATPDPVGLITGGLLTRGVAARNRIEDLGTPLGQLERDNSFPIALADNGLIVGATTNGEMDTATDFPQVRAVLWQAGHGIALGDLGGNGSQAWAVNNAGMVAGVALDAVPDNIADQFYGLPAATRSRAFVWRHGTMEDIGTLGGPDANAMAINDAGQVAGNSSLDATVHATTGFPTVHPFLWQNGRIRDVGTLGGTLSTIGPSGGLFGAGEALNRRGEIAGTSTLAGDTIKHAFLWTNGLMRDLGTLGGANSQALAINENGDAVGIADLEMGSRVFHAFFWHDGHMNDLGTLPGCDLSKAFSVNNLGDSVGIIGACSGDVIPRGFVSFAGAPMVDLNDLVIGDPGMLIFEAYYINNAGDIAAIGLLPSGDVHAVLLRPTNESNPAAHVVIHVKPDLHGAAWRGIHDDELSGLPARHRGLTY
jgi:probable HAF family extracellular repeat protein